MKSLTVTHVGGELGGVQCGGHQAELEVRPERKNVPDENQQEISDDVPFVNLVDDDVSELLEILIRLEFLEENPSGAVEDAALTPW